MESFHRDFGSKTRASEERRSTSLFRSSVAFPSTNVLVEKKITSIRCSFSAAATSDESIEQRTERQSIPMSLSLRLSLHSRRRRSTSPSNEFTVEIDVCCIAGETGLHSSESFSADPEALQPRSKRSALGKEECRLIIMRTHPHPPPRQTSDNEWRERDEAKQGLFEWMMLVAHSGMLPPPIKSMFQIEERFEIVGKRVNATGVLISHVNHLFRPFSAEARLIEHKGGREERSDSCTRH